MVEYGYNEDGELAELSAKTRRPEPEVSIVHVEGELFAASGCFMNKSDGLGKTPT